MRHAQQQSSCAWPPVTPSRSHKPDGPYSDWTTSWTLSQFSRSGITTTHGVTETRIPHTAGCSPDSFWIQHRTGRQPWQSLAQATVMTSIRPLCPSVSISSRSSVSIKMRAGRGSSDTAPEICHTASQGGLQTCLKNCMKSGNSVTRLHPGILFFRLTADMAATGFESVQASPP